jgi:TonB family protein
MQRAFGLLLLLAASLTAAEVSGKWTGSMRSAIGPGVPISLTLQEQGDEISGSIAFNTDERQAPIEYAELRGERLTFQVPDRLNHIIAFQLTVGVRSISGEATSEGKTLKVNLHPVPRPGVYSAGGAVSAPRLIYKVEPEYSEEARQAKLQGTVLLYVEISPEGKATNMKVLHSLGFGLDEKAMEAVTRWKFKPGMKGASRSPWKSRSKSTSAC